MAAAGKITFVFDGKNGNTGRAFQRGVTRYAEAQIKALQATAKKMTIIIENKAREHIASRGNFSSARWQLGMRALLSYRSRTDLRIRVTHKVPYWRVFEYAPTVIKGKPMLWIPLSFAGVPKGMYARDFPEPMFRVDRPGKAPLLISDTGPKYFGKEQVTIRTKWNVRNLVRTAIKQMPRIYKEEMAKARKGG